MRKTLLFLMFLMLLTAPAIRPLRAQMSIARGIAQTPTPPVSPCQAGAIRFARSTNSAYICGPNNTWTVFATGGGGGTAQIIEAKSKFPVTSGLVFPLTFVGSGSGWKYFDGLGVEDATTLNADATWALAFEMPPA